MPGVFRVLCCGRLFAVIVLFVAGLFVVGIGMLLGFVVAVAMLVVALLAICVVIVDILIEHDDFDPRVAPTPKRIGGGHLRLVRTGLAQAKAIGIDSLFA